ncbi:Osmotically inducible protein Y precursor [Chitinispirillum alkaliphilum]|nr:Osmotically inducible protein Y precursor [Chitinispirillum alkaliphilum]
MAYTDEEIRRVVQDQLAWDGRLSNSQIEISVQGGKVTMSGEVSSFTARQAAETDALMVPGVMEVDNRTVIGFPYGEQKLEDRELKVSILNRFLWNPNIPASEIDVGVSDGVVSLKGSVDGYWKKVRAEEIVYGMSGVINVRNEIAVVPSKEYSDKEIADVITNAMERNEYIDPQRVELQVDNGIVAVSGTLESRNEVFEIIRIIKYTRGVREIVNLLDIARRAA